MEARKEILVADDETAVRRAFKALLEAEGFSVALARDGDEAVARFAERRPDLVLLDVMMPRMNGLAACAEIRKADGLVPVLFFTAAPSDATMVRAFGYGADDYIAKDRSPDEFVARIRAALRRGEAYGAAAADRLALGGATVDFGRMSVETEEGRRDLTRSEGVVLKLLASEPGRFFSYDELFAALGGEGYVGDEAAARMLMSRLKRKLGRAGALVVSARGVGYKLLA